MPSPWWRPSFRTGIVRGRTLTRFPPASLTTDRGPCSRPGNSIGCQKRYSVLLFYSRFLLLYLMLISSYLIGQSPRWQFWMLHGNVTRQLFLINQCWNLLRNGTFGIIKWILHSLEDDKCHPSESMVDLGLTSVYSVSLGDILSYYTSC